MPTISRALSGEVLIQDLDEERQETADPAIIERTGRNARTLIKDGPLRVTMVVLGKEGEIPEHSADGPITIQPIEGRIHFTAHGQMHEIGPGELIATGPGIPHSVRSPEGATFLLTLVQREKTRERGDDPDRSDEVDPR